MPVQAPGPSAAPTADPVAEPESGASEPRAEPEPAVPEPARGPLAGFHPAVATWFARRFPDGPTPAQSLGWAQIREGRDTLIAAPTGSGKTLAWFLVAIDACYR
ncbi:MAG: DEAD/DEAH box helicase, partial [Acidimicrobiales bacterium]